MKKTHPKSYGKLSTNSIKKNTEMLEKQANNKKEILMFEIFIQQENFMGF